MKPAPRALWLGQPERRLFAVLHMPATPPRAAVLINAPLLHEHARSYRLFALLADALADHAVATLRFDYYGTGDADGADEDFTLAGATADTRTALAYLRAQAQGVPVALLGVRAGALISLALAVPQAVDAVWLWQAIVSASEHLADLQQRDRTLRAARVPGEPARQSQTLIGLPVAPALLEEMRGPASVAIDDPALPPLLVLDAPGAARVAARAQSIALPAGLHEWTAQMEMGHFPLAAVRAIAARLAAAFESP